MNETKRAQVQAEIYAKGIGTYRGYILEYSVDEDLWLCAVSLRSGVVAQTEEIADMLRYIDHREDGY